MDDDGTILTVDQADLHEVAGVVRSDEHGHPLVQVCRSDRVVEGVKDGVSVDTVSPGARSDQGLLHRTKLPCCREESKVTCDKAMSPGHGCVPKRDDLTVDYGRPVRIVSPDVHQVVDLDRCTCEGTAHEPVR